MPQNDRRTDQNANTQAASAPPHRKQKPRSGAASLATDIQFVRGVGPARAKAFAKLGVRTVLDLIEYFPFRHELEPKSQPIDTLELGVVATIVGELRRVRSSGRFAKTTVTTEVVDGTGRCRVRWFHSPYLLDRLEPDRVVRLTGKVDVYRDLALLTNPKITFVDENDPLAADADRYRPIYSGSAELPGTRVARIVGAVLRSMTDSVADFLPDRLREARNLPPRQTAIHRFHHPTCADDIAVARHRLAYEELLLCQLAVQISRHRISTGPRAKPIHTSQEIDRRIRRRFPFELTAGQNAAIVEIRDDLARSVPMNRLLQGDVGAGKTAVAVYAALTAIANRRQVALVAPTEVLASQHRSKIEQSLRGSKVRMAYLAGSTPASQRAEILRNLAAGSLDFVIGTHALFEPDVRFADLGLVIIDEQHKFGVAQRAALRSKGRAAHSLVLTATPIPRTLAMTLFGDLDVTTIRGILPNRQPVTTRLVPTDKTDEAWSFIRKRLSAGEQAYIVYPLVEESDALPLKAAAVEVDRLSGSVLRDFRVGLLHGRMKPRDKDETMQRFRTGEINALVSTTVIEVGVDIPNATLMIIQHAERFGLSQLHQLRGRVGRGAKKSYCLLFAEPSIEGTPRRLDILCETDDGFRIAEEDLRLRGPGELLGTRQHGLPTFKVANLVTDLNLLERARDDAADILRLDADLSQEEHAPLRDELARRYGETARLIDVA